MPGKPRQGCDPVCWRKLSPDPWQRLAVPSPAFPWEAARLRWLRTTIQTSSDISGWGSRTVDEEFEKQPEAVKAGNVKFYRTGAGTTDMAHEGTVNLENAVTKAGFENPFTEIPGAHYWFLNQFGPIRFR